MLFLSTVLMIIINWCFIWQGELMVVEHWLPSDEVDILKTGLPQFKVISTITFNMCSAGIACLQGNERDSLSTRPS